MADLLLVSLRGIAQVFLLPRALPGVLLLAGLLFSSPRLAAAALLGSVLGACIARLLQYPRHEIGQGLFGFNAALASMAVHVLYVPGASTALAAAGAAAATVPLARALRRLPFPAYTAPFVLVVWTIPVQASWLGLQPTPSIPLGNAPVPDPAAAVFSGIAQVLFVEGFPAGLVFLLALSIGSPRDALVAPLASACGLLLGFALGTPTGQLDAGLMGFNAVLAALAVSRGGAGLLPALLAGATATLLMRAALAFELMALTAPFVLTVWTAGAWRRRAPDAAATR